MRIVARQKDYFDSVQGAGQDYSLTYVRDTKEEELDIWPFPRLFDIGGYLSSRLLEIRTTMIGFCGKIYPLIEVHISAQDCKNPKRSRQGIPIGGLWRKCFTLDDVDKFIASELSDNRAKIYHKMSRQTFVEFFDECKRDKEKHADMFSLTRPIFAAKQQSRWGEGHRFTPIIYNPLLREYEFARVLDPYTAFQELQMWLSNQAVPQKPMPVIADTLKAESHGFNRFSFRKDPGGKKRTRREKK